MGSLGKKAYADNK